MAKQSFTCKYNKYNIYRRCVENIIAIVKSHQKLQY